MFEKKKTQAEKRSNLLGQIMEKAFGTNKWRIVITAAKNRFTVEKQLR